MQKNAVLGLATEHATGVRIIRSAGRNRQHAGTDTCDLVLRGGGRSLGCGSGTGENKNDNESANDIFHEGILLGVDRYKLLIICSLDLLSATEHATSVRIVRSAGRNWQHAGAGDGDLVLRGGAGGLGCGGCTGENEDDNKCANDMFHSEILPKLYLCKKISLDKPDDVTIRYKLE
jgi:hypothetical protein